MKRKTRIIKIGNKKIGNGFPILVQSMCNTDTKNVASTVKQINDLEAAGCEIIRVAVSDIKSAMAIKEIKKNINIPIVADIHFDYKLAVESAKFADKIRINPGNIGSDDKIKKVIDSCRDYQIPLRIGVNSGSLKKDIVKKFRRTSTALYESGKEYIKLFEKLDFDNIIVSMKSSDVVATVEANRLFSKNFNYPIHLGVTEAGPYDIGVIKSSVAIGTLLLEGIGDTIRISLTGEPVREIFAGIELLKALDLRKGRRFISCPTCARTTVDLIKIANEIEKLTRKRDKNKKIAVMGCDVNGPGEAKDADIGVACCKGFGYIFKKGKIIKRVKEEEILKEMLKQWEKL